MVNKCELSDNRRHSQQAKDARNPNMGGQPPLGDFDGHMADQNARRAANEGSGSCLTPVSRRVTLQQKVLITKKSTE